MLAIDSVLRLLSLVAAMSTCGCSWLTSDPLPKQLPADEEPDCEPSHRYLPAAVDIAFAQVSTSLALCDGFVCPTNIEERAIPFLVAALFWKAAYDGLTSANRCWRAHRDHAIYQRANP
jgi:hypothetical protein